MGLYRFKPAPSGRMGVLWTLSTVRDSVIVEFGCMGHMLYTGSTLKRKGISNGCKLYSTHITETDISLGEAARLEKAVDKIVKEVTPKAVFLTTSSIPEVIGMDIKAIGEELRTKYHDIHLVHMGCGGFDKTGYHGVSETLNTLCRTLPKDIEKTKEITFNLIGSCPDMFRYRADEAEIVRILRGAFGINPICVLASNTGIHEIEKMSSAHINLVIRREGRKAAKYLEKKYNIPYLYGRPYGIEGTIRWLKKIAEITGLNINRGFIEKERKQVYEQLNLVMPNLKRLVRTSPEKATLSLGGHYDVVKGILGFGCDELHLIKGECWCDSPEMGDDLIPYYSEQQWSKAVSNHKKGWIMGSGEALEWAGKNPELQISNPDTKWRIYPYEAPFLGFRGAMNLANIWINTAEVE